MADHSPDRIDRLAHRVIHDCCCEAVTSALTDHAARAVVTTLRRKRLARPVNFSAWLARQERFVRRIKKALRAHWAWEARLILANLKKLRREYRAKAGPDSVLYPTAEAKKKLVAAMLQELAALIVYFGDFEVARLGLGGFDLDNPHTRAWLKRYALKLAAAIEAESLERLRASLAEGLANNETVSDLSKRIRALFSEWEKWRADRIARTECIRAANQGALEAYRQNGVLKKVWVTYFDERTCAWCEDLDGHVVDIDENYYELGDTVTASDEAGERRMAIGYEAIGAPPLHPRCRCAISAWIED